MAVYLKKFENHAAYTAAQSGLILPNVSICVQENDVHYNPMPSVSGVTLNKGTLSLGNGETETLVATVLPNNAGNKNVTWSSSNGSVATVSNNGLVTAVGNIGDNANIIVTTVDGGYTAQCAFSVIDPYNGHDYVEIGGLKWATMNIGANSVTDGGLYFQWADTSGYTTSQVGSKSWQKKFGWVDYKYGNGIEEPTSVVMTKYNSTDGLTTLEATDDAVTAAWGGSWRMPTTAEYAALGAAVNSAWTADYQGSGVSGLVLTDKTDSSKVLFFPSAGYCCNGSFSNSGGYVRYYSSSLENNDVRYAYGLYADFGRGVNWQNSFYRYLGFPVRGVVG